MKCRLNYSIMWLRLSLQTVIPLYQYYVSFFKPNWLEVSSWNCSTFNNKSFQIFGTTPVIVVTCNNICLFVLDNGNNSGLDKQLYINMALSIIDNKSVSLEWACLKYSLSTATELYLKVYTFHIQCQK